MPLAAVSTIYVVLSEDAKMLLGALSVRLFVSYICKIDTNCKLIG